MVTTFGDVDERLGAQPVGDVLRDPVDARLAGLEHEVAEQEEA